MAKINRNATPNPTMKILLTAFFVFFFGWGYPKQVLKVGEGIQEDKKQQKLALLVGISEYKVKTNLPGCQNDLDLMEALLKSKYGFSDDDILILDNEKATYQGIIDGFRSHLVDKAEKDAVVLFYFSGHGSQIKNIDGEGDIETDGYDETLVAYDSRFGDVYDIRDDEINGLLQLVAQKTDNVTFILDACHSGSGAKGDMIGIPKEIKKDKRPPPPLPEWAVMDKSGGMNFKSAKYAMISGCRSNQQSRIIKPKGIPVSALTLYLVRELLRQKGKVTYKDVMDNVSTKVNRLIPSQLPDLEGPNENKVIFGDKTILAEPHVLVSSVGNKILVEAGTLQGMTVGSLFAVYPPKTKSFANTKPIAAIRLSKILHSKAEAIVIKGQVNQTACRAREIEHNYEDLKLHVSFEGKFDSQRLKSIRSRIIQHSNIEESVKGMPSHIAFINENGKLRVKQSSAVDPDLYATFDPGNPNTEKEIMDFVDQWMKWYNVLSIDNPGAGLDVDLSLTLKKAKGGGKTLAFVQKTKVQYADSDQVDIKITNKSDKDIYFHIFDLRDDGKIDLCKFSTSGKELLSPGTPWKQTIRVTVPDGRKVTRDVFKVIATTDQNADFSFLEKNGHVKKKGGGDGKSLEDLLYQYGKDPDGGQKEKKIKLDSWTTIERVFVVAK